MARLLISARRLGSGNMRCKYCGQRIFFPAGAWLYAMFGSGRALVLDARNLAPIHRCGITRVAWCPTCRDRVAEVRLRRRGGRRNSRKTPVCGACGDTLVMKQEGPRVG